MKNILEQIDKLIELSAPRIHKPGSIGHRGEGERRQEKDKRRTQDYKMWRKRYNNKRNRVGYRPDFNTKKAAERSAKFRRNH